MRLSKSFLSLRNRPVYGLPTLRGLAMFASIGLALWFSITERSALEQWFAFLMILLVLLHLLEMNDPFRDLQASVLPVDPPFANEAFSLPILLVNPSSLASETLYLKWEGDLTWMKFPALEAQSSATVFLPVAALSPGRQSFPELRMKMLPASQLFRLWKVFPQSFTLSVLPAANDHQVPLTREVPSSQEDGDFSELEPIRDPRLLPKKDQKLFLKTGLPYLRTRPRAWQRTRIILSWEDLQNLTATEQNEQFSSWLKTLQKDSALSTSTIQVTSPFFQGPIQADQLRLIKEKFADWLSDARA